MGRQYINSRGVILASFIEDEGLGTLKTGDMAYFHSPTGTLTAIGISCSTNALLDFTRSVLLDLYGSGHFSILIEKENASRNLAFHGGD